jgi:hypothetical protein
MKNLKELEAIARIIIEHNLPKTQILFMDFDEKRETDQLLKNLGSSGINSLKIPTTELLCDSIMYCNIKFYIVETDYVEPKTPLELH